MEGQPLRRRKQEERKESDSSYDAPKPGGPMTTRQPAEDSWMSGNPTPHHRAPFFGSHDLTKNQTVSFVQEALPKIQHVQKP